MKTIIDLCLSVFKHSLLEVLPSECVQKILRITSDSKLYVGNREFKLHKNVYIVAIGKAALSMVEGAEQALGEHVVRGIASVPMGTNIKHQLKTICYEGAQHNLPDQKAIETAERIETFLGEIQSPEDIVLFLISAISLDEKLNVIRLMTTHGADIKQLNTVRISLSRLKGGKLGLKAAPAKAISLIMSDIIGDPLDLIASGPTVISEDDLKNPVEILKELYVWDEISAELKNYLKSYKPENLFDQKVDIINEVVGNNQLLLKTLFEKFLSHEIISFVAPEPVEGDATDIASKYVDFLLNLSTGCTLLGGLNSKNISIEKPTVMIFGGETTVNFSPDINLIEAKGGRNQEMVLAFFQQILISTNSEKKPKDLRFAFFSLGSDGQDGPTDATGAFITSDDIPSSETKINQLLNEVELWLNSKNSYDFWAKFNDGSNHVKIGKTGNNLMDVQLLYVFRK